MTLSGLEPVKTVIHTPAVDVAYGRITLQQAHQRYQGIVLLCPHCLQEWTRRQGNIEIAEERLGQQSAQTAEMWEQWLKLDLKQIGLAERLAIGVESFPEDLRVKFRRATLNENNSVERWMHFYHVVNRKDRPVNRPCHDPSCISHEVALGAIKLMLEEEYTSQVGIEVIKEQNVLLTPEQTRTKRCPDLMVKRHGQIERLLEVQRTVLSGKDFIERTQHLLTLCYQVEWYFFKDTYAKMGPQRRWLSEQGLPFYYLHWDGYKLKLEEGQPPKERNTKTTTNKPASVCVYTEVDDTPIKKPATTTGPLLPLSVVGKAEFGQRFASIRQPPLKLKSEHQFPRWGCSLGDIVEVWVKGKWRKGTVNSYDSINTPIVELERVIGTKRRITPIDPKLLRPYQISDLNPPKATVEQPNSQQLSLFQS